jgi:hypothetical protein
VFAALASLAACGGGESAGGGGEAQAPEESQEETSGEQALTPVEATVSDDENSAMMPAGGKEKDTAQSPPESPPEGIQTFPATTNENISGTIAYDRDPPTNGDHSPRWQNCGFYSSPVDNEYAVHTMDHGAVWLAYRPDLPQDQIDQLRQLAQEDYILVSPYENLYAPVVATAWRNQLDLEDAEDPRLRQFVDQFRLSETAPLSGNGCTGGVGEPEA